MSSADLATPWSWERVQRSALLIGLSGVLIESRSFGWDVTIRGATNTNTLKSLGNLPPVIGTLQRFEVGYPLNGYWAQPITHYADANHNGDETIKFLPKLKLEVLVKDWDVHRTMEVIGDALRTGQIGDGKIIVFEASSAMRIRTGEKGVYAL